jgi:hypothetical protein
MALLVLINFRASKIPLVLQCTIPDAASQHPQLRSVPVPAIE